MSRRSLGHSSAVWGLRALPVVGLVGAWLYANGPGGVSPLVLPPLRDVLRDFERMYHSSTIIHATMVTLEEVVIASILSVVVGIAIGFYFGRYNLSSKVLDTFLAWAYMFPLVLFYPIFILWLGVGIKCKIIYAFCGGVVPVAFNTLRGVRDVNPRFVQVARAFGASKRDIDLHVKAGAAIPMILAGVRTGVSMVLIFVVLGELLGSNAGLGHEINNATSTLDNTYAVALIFVVIIVTLVVQSVLEALTGWSARRDRRRARTASLTAGVGNG